MNDSTEIQHFTFEGKMLLIFPKLCYNKKEYQETTGVRRE